MSELSFRNADPKADFEFARTVHHETYREVVTQQFESWDESIQDNFFMEGWKRSPHKIILFDGSPVGIISILQQADHVFLSEIQILPEFQGQGIGSRLIKEQMDNARKLGLPLRLQVLRQNKAQQLYLRLGFAVTKTSETHIILEWADNPTRNKDAQP